MSISKSEKTRNKEKTKREKETNERMDEAAEEECSKDGRMREDQVTQREEG